MTNTLKRFTYHRPILKSAAIIFLICCQHYIAYAQTKIIDSLQHKIATEENNSKKLPDIFALCSEYRSMHPDTLGRYISMARSLAVQDSEIANTEYFEAIYLNRLGKTDSSDALIEKNLQLKHKVYDAIRNNFLLLKSNFLIRANRQKESIQNSFALLHEAEAQKDIITEIKAKIMIGWGYMELAQNRDALNWLLQSVEMQQKKDTAIPISVAYNNIAAVYNELKKNDSAAMFIVKGLSLLKKNRI